MKTKTVLKYVLFFLIIFAFIFISKAFFYFREINLENQRSQELEKKITFAIKNNGRLEFLPITSFAWDKFYIFRPYTSIEKINEKLGFKWLEKEEEKIPLLLTLSPKKTHINYLDDRNLLVFTKGESVIRHVDFLRKNGDFQIAEKEDNVFNPGDAIFSVNKKAVTHEENIQIITYCLFKKNVPSVKNSKETFCTLSSFSGYTEFNLVVLDQLEKSYLLRIFGGIGDVKNIPSDRKFSLVYEKKINVQEKEKIWMIDRLSDQVFLERYIDGKIILVGFINRDDTSFNLVWKS